MTSLLDQTYFPPLQDCLQGSKALLSWKLVAEALSDESSDRLTSSAVATFLQDPLVLRYLKGPQQLFEAPSAKSKSDFDSKTAAINVAPTPNDKYDIKTVKGDAQWLSQAVKVNETVALRVVVVEFQSRPFEHLAGPLSSQDVANLQEVLGGNHAQVSAVLAPVVSGTLPDAETIWADFESATSRRRRLLATYLSERRSFMAVADHFMTFLLHSQPSRSGEAVDVLRKSLLKDGFGFDLDTDFNINAFEALIPRYLQALPLCLDRLQTGPGSLDGAILTSELEADWVATCLVEIVHAMTLIFQILDLSSQLFANPDAVRQWFQIMDSCAFMDSVTAVPESASDLMLPIRSLVCVISCAFLNLKRSLAYLDRAIELQDFENPYLQSVDDLEEIHLIIMAALETYSVTASPICFCWSLILHHMRIAYQERAERRDIAQNQRAQDGFELEHQSSAMARRHSAGSIVSIEHQPYDSFLTAGAHERDAQVVEKLARTATAGGLVFDWITEMSSCMGSGQDAAFRPVIGSRMRLIFLDILKISFPFVGYLPEPVSALLSVLSAGRQYWDLSEDLPVLPTQDVVALARTDADLRSVYLSQALHRFPYEFIPFASLCRILSTCKGVDEAANPLLELLFNAPTLTFVLPPSYNQYELAQEEDNTNTIRLTEEIPLFAAGPGWKRRYVTEEAFCVPRDTYGRFVTDSGRVVMLDYQHSALALLGKRLECNLAPESYVLQLGALDLDETREAVLLLATLVRAEVIGGAQSDSTAVSEVALSILEEASRSVSGTRDIISVVCDTLDGLLGQDLVNSDEAEISVLTACLEFLHAVLPVCPGRVWSYMARCDLLNTDSKAARLSAIIGTLDLTGERFSCLAASVKFFSSLVDSIIESAVQRKVGVNFKSRQRGAVNPWLGTSDKVLARVSLSICQSIIDIYDSSLTWRFSSELQRSAVLADVVVLLNNIVSKALSLGTIDASDNLLASLVPAANYAIENFLASPGPLRFQPIVASLLAAVFLPSSTLYPWRRDLASLRFRAVADFATTLLRVAEYLGQPSAGLQAQLFRAAGLVAKVCAVNDSSRSSAFQLLSTLVVSANNVSSEPPSLLGYLGPQTSRSFIQVTSSLDGPYDRPSEEVQTWRFFTAILCSRQQWMANCLLTGKTPRDAVEGTANSPGASSGSVLSTALKRLQSISSLDTRLALAVLDFVTSAQNYWPWTVFATQSSESVWDALRAYVRELKAPSVVARSDPGEAALQVRIAAYIAETFAMRLYHLRQTGDGGDFASKIIKDVDYFLRDAVQVAGYNGSLHGNLTRNFAARYSGCSLSDLQKTSLRPRHLGTEYFYALDTAELMLSFDSAWAGQKQNGFRNEVAMANQNLSLVDAETALLHAWEYLILELSAHLLLKDQTLPTQMLQVTQQCLLANVDAQGPDVLLASVNQSRADLALTLLQRLAASSLLPKDFSSLLTTTWVAIGACEDPFSEDQIQYYRTLLKVLYVVLRGNRHSDKVQGEAATTPTPASIVKISQTALNILDRVVAAGFRTLVGLVHEAQASIFPEDLAVITAIMQACLCLPGMDQCQGQILNIMASHDVLTVATSLFSWSDKLTNKGDPVYGELSLLFLLELSSLPLIAEQLACDGFLGQLTSANLSGLLRRPNVSPFADSASASRCYGIWAKAVLPLLLNILTALGATIAPEVAYVLNQFPNLLQASVDRFEPPGLSRTGDAAPPHQHRGHHGHQQQQKHVITLLAVSEIHSLALLTRVLAALRQQGGAANGRDIPAVVAWDAPALAEHVDFWLSSRRVLRERLVPLGARETEWRNLPAAGRAGTCENRLEEKVVVQLEAVRDVLTEGSG